MYKIAIVCLVSASLAGCAGLDVGALVADAIPAATALASDAGATGVQNYINAGIGAACAADVAYADVVAAISKQPNATVAQIAVALCQ
jgi:hypothetical protein